MASVPRVSGKLLTEHDAGTRLRVIGQVLDITPAAVKIETGDNVMVEIESVGREVLLKVISNYTESVIK